MKLAGVLVQKLKNRTHLAVSFSNTLDLSENAVKVSVLNRIFNRTKSNHSNRCKKRDCNLIENAYNPIGNILINN